MTVTAEDLDGRTFEWDVELGKYVRTPWNDNTDLKWRIMTTPNPWFSLGIHIDHVGPFVVFHLPGIIIYAGRMRA